MKVGDRVFITDKTHPWFQRSGEVVSGEETYGLGWKGYRVKIDDTCHQETYVRPDQVMGPALVTSMKFIIRKRSKRKE